MNMQPTCGPLRVTRELDAEGCAQHTIRTAEGSPVAVLSNYSPREQKANADLYANAPDLFKLAGRLFSFYELHKSARGGQLGRDYEALRAKIMGESPDLKT